MNFGRYTMFLLTLFGVLTLFVLLATLLSVAAWPHGARADVSRETCTSYQRATGTVVTECRQPGRKERHCESYTSITGSARTECR